MEKRTKLNEDKYYTQENLWHVGCTIAAEAAAALSVTGKSRMGAAKTWAAGTIGRVSSLFQTFLPKK